MSLSSDKRSEEFLQLSPQFKLGALTTESSHPITSRLSEVAGRDIAAGLDLLFQVDTDVLSKYRQFADSGRAREIAAAVLTALHQGGKIFFTGCGSTGRLSILLAALWRDFWGGQARKHPDLARAARDFEQRALPVMAGGDFALIKAVEGFEDFRAFGERQISELGLEKRDVVFAITEGGETSFVIGTAWKGLEVGAKVYFVYNNPDQILSQHVERSRAVIAEPRIEKINLTTGPMAITGSTRMQATSIQLCVLVTILEIIVRQLLAKLNGRGISADIAEVPADFLSGLDKLHQTLRSAEFLDQLAPLVSLEENVYRTNHKTSYFAGRFGIDVLTDTTERSPTFCTPPFRKFDDRNAGESWSFLFLQERETTRAWEKLLKRPPQCLAWNAEHVRELVGEEKVPRTIEILRKITYTELMRFRIGLDGLPYRPLGRGDAAVAVMAAEELSTCDEPASFFQTELHEAKIRGGSGLICFGSPSALGPLRLSIKKEDPECIAVFVPVPHSRFLLGGLANIAVKLVLNALSTCTMVRLGRVMGNYMVWVVPSNLKLIDRATRYIERLTGLPYGEANRLLFEVIEYVEPRMRADQPYPPVVVLAVTRARHQVGNVEAERLLATAAQPIAGQS